MEISNRSEPFRQPPALAPKTPFEYAAVHAGWEISGLITMVHNTSFGIDHIPKTLLELPTTDGWQKHIVPYGEELVEYGPDEFEKFVVAEPSKGLETTIARLKAICSAAGTPEGQRCVRLLQAMEANK
jgi:hypothetical protein